MVIKSALPEPKVKPKKLIIQTEEQRHFAHNNLVTTVPQTDKM